MDKFPHVLESKFDVPSGRQDVNDQTKPSSRTHAFSQTHAPSDRPQGTTPVKSFAEPFRPSAEALCKIDDITGVAAPDEPAMASWYRNYSRHHRVRLAFDIDHAIAHLPAGGRILEYGSVPPLFTGALARSGFTVCGLDLAPDRFATAFQRLQLEVARCNVETDPVPHSENSFDGVVFNEVFEHLRINPIFTLREALRVLKPGGVFLLSTPNLWSFRGIRNFLFRQQAGVQSVDMFAEYEKLATLGHMGHVREYTPREVVEFLRKTGFQIDGIIFRGDYHSSGGKLAARIWRTMRPGLTILARKG